jgi:hypothetical protein
VAIKKALVDNKNLHISFTFPFIKKFQILGNMANKNFGLAKALIHQLYKLAVEETGIPFGLR